ncbi:MAG TPA: hypothetical protein VJW76_11520 [Verrucomicrobiae bacterium]|nr:hypothetical protein [Verrucomicrobiae bacterium]
MPKRVQKRRPPGWWTLFYGIGWILLAAGVVMMLINIVIVIRTLSTNPDHLAGFFTGLPLIFIGSLLVSANWANSKRSYCPGCGTEVTDKDDKSCRICWTLLE